MINCAHCDTLFEITERDLSFLKRIAPIIDGRVFDVPPPKCCPDCRWQRRLSFRNERVLYRRNCDLTGQSMISIYPPGTRFPVYNINDWISDKWDATEYGRDFDFSRPFFEQYKEMKDLVPHFNLSINPSRDINSEYTNCATDSKNCYLISQAESNEDCYYSRGINNCRNCCDCLRVDRCELCYESINLSLCYHCFYCQDCDNCSNCYFSSNLRGCKNCFGCHNVIQKEYLFFNEQLSRVEWEDRISKFRFTYDAVQKTNEASNTLRWKTPHRYARVIQCEDSTGDHLMNCRDALNCYDSRNLEHCKFVAEVQSGAKYCYDYSMCGVDTELVYECVGCGYSAYQLLFCSDVWSSVSQVLYSGSCGPGVRNSFGCFGIRSQEYCILNKPYNLHDYNNLVSRIIDHMRQTGEWGEFFPPWVSSDAYNDTLAGSYFPLTKNDVVSRGWNWRDHDETISVIEEENVQAPMMSVDAQETLLNQILNCEKTGRPFKVIRQELDFLKRLDLPIPRLHPEIRYAERAKRRNPRRLWTRQCAHCKTTVESTYSPERNVHIYCESCYQDIVA